MLDLEWLMAVCVRVCFDCLREGTELLHHPSLTGAPELVCRGQGLFIITVLYLYAFQFHAESVVVYKQLFVSTLTLLQLGFQFSFIVSTHLLKLLQLLLSLISPDDNTMFTTKTHWRS